MLTLAKISTRGQVAIPKTIRDRLNLRDGDILLFEDKDGRVYLRKIKNFLDFEGSLLPPKLPLEKTGEKAMEEMAREVAGA